MPNPQSNNHQSRDGSGSGDRGRTFRPIEVSDNVLYLVARRPSGSVVRRIAVIAAVSIFPTTVSEESPEGLL